MFALCCARGYKTEAQLWIIRGHCFTKDQYENSSKIK